MVVSSARSIRRMIIIYVFYFFQYRQWLAKVSKEGRTTNHAEGWHNSQNHTLGISHPSPRTFLNWLQQHHFYIQCRDLQLQAGRSPKKRSPVYMYVRLDQDIVNAKVKLSLNIGQIFAYSFTPIGPNTNAWHLVGNELHRCLPRCLSVWCLINENESKTFNTSEILIICMLRGSKLRKVSKNYEVRSCWAW